MPRPRPTVDQRQHILRCDDALWAKIAARAEALGVAINPYLNFVLTVAVEQASGTAALAKPKPKPTTTNAA